MMEFKIKNKNFWNELMSVLHNTTSLLMRDRRRPMDDHRRVSHNVSLYDMRGLPIRQVGDVKYHEDDEKYEIRDKLERI